MSRPGDVQCWRCGLFYVAALPSCPVEILGCGAPKRFVEELAEIAIVEEQARDQLGRLRHLVNAIAEKSGEPMAVRTIRALYYARMTLEACARLREGLREEKEAA